METIRQVIRERDQLDDTEVDELFADAADELASGEAPDEVLAQVFGLEPDYIDDPEFWSLVELNFDA